MTGKNPKKKNHPAIAFNVIHIDSGNFYTNLEKIFPAYVSKHNSEGAKQIIHLMIPNEIGIMALFCSNKTNCTIKRSNDDDFYCLNCFHLFRTKKSRLKSNKRDVEM